MQTSQRVSTIGIMYVWRFDDWHHVRVRKQKGTIYARKLMYLTRRARADEFAALAIVVDTDKSKPREKLRQLRDGRDADRQNNPPFPTALGEANPHFDVWLLDDEKAIRDALQLTSDHNIPNIAKTKDPKEMLSAIIADAPAEFADVSAALGAIAEQLNPQRCVHRKETGLATFIEDVDGEVRPVVCS